MKCFVDSNIFISAGIFPNSVPAAAVMKALSPPNVAFVSDYVLDEITRVGNDKFPHKARDIERFLYRTLFLIQRVPTPTDIASDEAKISDIKDHPVLRAALSVDVDVIITGDKKFIASGITQPRLLLPTDFMNL